MVIMGVDQSYTSCGIVVLNRDAMIHCEKYVSCKEADMFARAAEVADYLSHLCMIFHVDVVGLEGLAYAKSGNATRDLAGLQFTIVHQLRECDGHALQIISPNTVKKTATGKGNADKPTMCEQLPADVRAAFDELGVKKTTGLLDLSDAYWIAKSVDVTEGSEV